MVRDEHGLADSPRGPDQFALLPGVGPAVCTLNELGILAVVVSNQPGVAKRKMSTRQLGDTTKRMVEDLLEAGARLDAVYYCLHHPDALRPSLRAVCDCRKPKPGLLLRAAQELHIDLRESYMVGDRAVDIAAGRQAGCSTILVGTSSERARGPEDRPDYTAPDLAAAVRLIQERSHDHRNLR